MKLYELKNIKQCPFKAYISKFGFKTMDKKSSMIRGVYKTILTLDNFLELNKDRLKEVISNELNDIYFLTKQEKDVEVTIMFSHLLRYQDYENKLHRRILAKNIYSDIQLENETINVKADIVFENPNSIELIKYKTGATKLSCKARTEKNLPENDIELFLLKEMGKKIYCKFNKPIIASYYHLKGKSEDKEIYKQFLEDKSVLLDQVSDLKSTSCNDKKEQKKIDKQIKEIEDVLYFNNSQGNNIITFDYNKDLSEDILKLCSTELSFESEKCQSSDCEFCDYNTLCNHKAENNNNLEIVQEVKKSSSETKLTDNQRQVVDIEEGTYRINAVAGSGKSTTMVLRTIELFKKGYHPSDILMITFTNKGCEELKEKIEYWLKYYHMDYINPKHLNIFTFNGFGDTILSKEWNKLGFTQVPQLATTIDINDIIKELLEEYNDIEWLNYKNPLLNYPNSKGAFKQLTIYFNLIKSYGDKAELPEEVDFELVHEMYDKFNQKLKEKNLLQYQDQVLYLIDLFKTNSTLIEQYGYKHIIVDEYQDTDFTQVDLLHLLQAYKESKSFIVVGDDSQAIYSFRNTTPENILKFDEQFKDVKDIYLLDNFRSTPQICNVANSLIKLNTQRIDKDIISKKADGKIPQLIKSKTLDDERNYIVDLIKEKIQKSISKHEICYIGRTKKELLELQKQLTDNNIPSIVEASELYIDNINVQGIINLANFFKKTDYDYYLMEYFYMITDKEILNGLSTEQIASAINVLKEGFVFEIENINKEDNCEELKIDYFYSRVNELTKNDKVAYSFIEDIKARKFYTFNELLSYLYKIALYKDDTSIEKDENKYDAIVLTTAHSSKGKEWSVVINSINNYKYDVPEKELEEERRLLFVSITRAKDELYITYNTNEDKARNKGKYCRFADELENVDKMEI